MMQRSPRRWVLVAWLAATVASSPASALEPLPKLIEAVKAGDRETALALAAKKDGINAAEVDGTTALHWAAEDGDRELVEALLKAGADAKAANRYGLTPLQLAAENGDENMVKALLDAGADANAALPEGETVLMTAARTGVPAVLRLLLEHGANPESRENWFGESALIWAAAEDQADAVRLLASSGADVNGRSALATFPRRRSGQSMLPLGSWTPLMYAARENALAAGNALVESHADLDAVDPDSATALVIAIINANYEFAAMMLTAGANPNVVDSSGMAALYAAIDMHRLAVGHGRPNPKPTGLLDSVDTVKQLLAHGADPNAELTASIIQRQHTFGDGTLGQGATPLLRAAKSGDIEIVRLLVAAGADPKHAMPDGATALMYAAGLGWRNPCFKTAGLEKILS
jgi:ankyrin repeat protein